MGVTKVSKRDGQGYIVSFRLSAANEREKALLDWLQQWAEKGYEPRYLFTELYAQHAGIELPPPGDISEANRKLERMLAGLGELMARMNDSEVDKLLKPRDPFSEGPSQRGTEISRRLAQNINSAMSEAQEFEDDF